MPGELLVQWLTFFAMCLKGGVAPQLQVKRGHSLPLDCRRSRSYDEFWLVSPNNHSLLVALLWAIEELVTVDMSF